MKKHRFFSQIHMVSQNMRNSASYLEIQTNGVFSIKNKKVQVFKNQVILVLMNLLNNSDNYKTDLVMALLNSFTHPGRTFQLIHPSLFWISFKEMLIAAFVFYINCQLPVIATYRIFL